MLNSLSYNFGGELQWLVNMGVTREFVPQPLSLERMRRGHTVYLNMGRGAQLPIGGVSRIGIRWMSTKNPLVPAVGFEPTTP